MALNESFPQPDPELEEESLFDQAAVTFLVFAVIALGWIRVRDGRISLKLFVETDSWMGDLAWGVVAALVLVAVWEVARRLWESPRLFENKLRDFFGELSGGEIVGVSLMAGFAEELLFRGAMQISWGIIPATIIFGAFHLLEGKIDLSWILSALLGGGVFGLLLLWTGNLLAPMVAHFVLNSINLRLLMMRGPKKVTTS